MGGTSTTNNPGASLCSKPKVSVLLPAYRAEQFICETLEGLSKQTFKNFILHISIDKSDDNTEKIVQNWCNNHRDISSEIHQQTKRLGWVRNINFLLKKCNTKYFMIMPHDDILHEKYIEKMLHQLRINTQACTAFSDIKCFGKASKHPHIDGSIISQPSILGNKIDRINTFINFHFGAVAFRGLVNRSILSDLYLLQENNQDNFAVDTIWNLQMAVKGELIRVPEFLYYKRYHDDSAHDRWPTHDQAEVVRVWLEHCKGFVDLLNKIKIEPDERLELLKSVKSRLFQENAHLYFPSAVQSLSQHEKDILLNALFHGIPDLLSKSSVYRNEADDVIKTLESLPTDNKYAKAINKYVKAIKAKLHFFMAM
jgi:glycosyltransferase involved in cell wall biosynthesis